MTERLKEHIRGMTDGQRSYFLHEVLRRNISILGDSMREQCVQFSIEFLSDLATPMTYDNCLKMLEMEETIEERMKGVTDVVLQSNSAAQFLNVYTEVAEPVLKELGVTLNTSSLLFNRLQVTYPSKANDGANTTKSITINSNGLQVMLHARYNVTKTYGEKSIETRSLLNLPLKDISELLPKKSLSDCTWEEIDTISKSGKASEYFAVGDEKNIMVGDEEITVLILGFEHDDLSDGTGKACITFGMKNLLADYYLMNGSSTNEGGWDKAVMRNSTMQSLLEDLPDDLVKVIKTVKKRTSAGNTSTDIVTSDDSLWLLSLAEICSERAIRNSAWSSISDYADTYMGEGEQYDYYKSAAGDIDPNDANDRLVKSLDDGSGSTGYWWLRSPYVGGSDNFLYVYDDGAVDYDRADASHGVCLGFCV